MKPYLLPPDEVFSEFFSEVQLSPLFKDSKTFTDARPKYSVDTISNKYKDQSTKADFCLDSFVLENFEVPESHGPESRSRKVDGKNVRTLIEELWSILSRRSDAADNSSLIALPFPYIVPGGRFREIYYWDSYFTMLGLAESGRVGMVENMVNNFAYLLDEIGLIPNGNRTYYCSRSQPPFFSLMVALLANLKKDSEVYALYLPQLKIEYEFWMAGSESLQKDGDAEKRVVQLSGSILNRYWDNNPIPRQESFKEDLELAASYSGNADTLFRNIRAAAETGWDFSSRWFRDASDLSSIRTAEIVPVDLNTLMFKLEETLAKTYSLQGNKVLQVKYETLAKKRKEAIQTIFYDEQKSMFVDLELFGGDASAVVSLAGVFPLYFGLAVDEQAKNVARELREKFLKQGGWVTTLKYTTHQWDAPNGWAPLQWMVYQGLKNYGFHDDAELGARRWIENNLLVYRQTGNLLEKYNVEALGTTAGGGEYEVQYGFGWTNAVLLKFMNALDWET